MYIFYSTFNYVYLKITKIFKVLKIINSPCKSKCLYLIFQFLFSLFIYI